MKVLKINLNGVDIKSSTSLIEIPKVDLKKGTKIQLETSFGKTISLAL